jgi:hypothetical protein
MSRSTFTAIKPRRAFRHADRGTASGAAAVAEQSQSWFEAEPWRTSRELFERLQVEQPGTYGDGQLRTLQRRLKGWRREATHRMVFGG